MFLPALLLGLVLPFVQAVPYVCNLTYIPTDYLHFSHVPVNCFTTTPSACQRSWKAGVPQGTATAKPLVYPEFIFCHESFSTCGYVPINRETGIVLGGSGVTIGGGVDLGSTERHSPAFRHLDRSIHSKIRPYIGLRQEQAACAAIERPLTLYSNEALTLTNAVKDYIVKEVEKRYNLDRSPSSVPFISLARGVRTALVSLWYQMGHPEAYPNFWRFATENDWEKATVALRDFYKNPLSERVENMRRRNDEADIIEATLVKCSRSLDAVVLLDESGSVTDQNFAESLEFVVNLTTAFSDAKLRGKYGTRMALSTFSHMYKSHFHLSNYKTHSQYRAAINGVQKQGGTTSLGYALSRVLEQFSETRGLRSERYGIPRVLIVLTDGRSHDSALIPAQKLHEMNVVVYAIGIGNFDYLQLLEIASSRNHVFLLASFVELETFIATLTAATCNEPQPIALKRKVEMTSPKSKFQYFVYKAKPNSLLEVSVKDLVGRTLMYVSRSNPHPYRYDSDLAFNRTVPRYKVVVISVPDRKKNVKRSVNGDRLQSVYVSVLANTKTAKFSIEAQSCDPATCQEGTNELATDLIEMSGTGFRTVAGFYNCLALLCAFLSVNFWR